jgi:hypothetical protein
MMARSLVVLLLLLLLLRHHLHPQAEAPTCSQATQK